MALSKQEKELISTLSDKVNRLVSEGCSEEAILVELFDFMPKIKALMDNVPKESLEACFIEYPGFYTYIKGLENLAKKIASGQIQPPD